MKKLISVLALITLLGASACTTTEASSGEVSPPVIEAVVPGTAQPTQTPAIPPLELSERGNITKEIGEGAGITTTSGDVVAEFVVDAIRVDPACTGDYVLPPENGHFIALDVSISTKPELADAAMQQFDLNPYGMKVVAPNGTTSNAYLGTTSAYSCLTPAEQIPPAGVGPAENVKGTIILDSQVPTGTLIVTAVGAQASWEYKF